MSKYALNTALFLLKVKHEFHNNKLESIKKDLDKWISNFQGLRIQMNEFSLRGSITNKDFMICTLNNLPKEYGVILNELENHLMVSGDIC